ncbi:hypothetical protein [Streptomyces tendae]|uniref:hypothetical protein n=1 Tax=Streptomyces tendae TaxID=1932 RepID=UPI0035711DE0
MDSFIGRNVTRRLFSPTPTSCLRGLHDRREEALTAALADTTDTPPDDITPRTAAALLGGVHRVLFTGIQELTLAGRTTPEIAEVLAREAPRAFDLLTPALAEYGRRAPVSGRVGDGS